MNSVREAISEMKGDYINGSSWYYYTISNLLSRVEEEGLNLLLRELSSIRPGMGSINNIEEAVLKNRVITVSRARELGRKLLDYREGALTKLRKQEKKIKIGKVMTISFSNSVKSLIEESPPEELVLLESRPGNESRTAAEQYEEYSDVTVIPDSAVLSRMRYVDKVLIGFDGLYSDGTLTNKIGTYPLCLSAREAGVEVIAVGESFKSTNHDAGPIPERDLKTHGRHSRIPLLEVVPLIYVDTLVTDIGQFRKPDSGTVDKLHRTFIDGIS
ncbi:MAG: hypothetical protein M0Z77_06330 [Thermoplasmatales archaeon]|nr:hypothetical protein [Thermoplasmatales archaeon]